MKDKVYIETTIVSYLAARPSRDLIVAGHQQLTNDWWMTRRPDFDLFTSQFAYTEAALGDATPAKKRLDLLGETTLLATTEVALNLALSLVQHGVVPKQFPEDASHIAVATVHGMDYLLTWNCKHIANAQLQKAMFEICRDAGYETPVICTPEELMGD